MKPFMAPRRPVFIDPDTHRRIVGKTKVELVQKIVTYRAQNDLEPIENLDMVLDNYWANLPENKGLTEDVTLERGLLTYLKGGLTLVKTMLFPQFVSTEVADTRAEICVDCPKNIFPEDKGAFASWADDIAEHATGNRKSKYHDELGNCAVCSCNLRALVHYGGKFDPESEEDLKQYPDFCWKLHELRHDR